MNDQPEQDPFSQHGLETTELFEAIENLDNTEQGYWNSCATYVESPTGPNLSHIADTAIQHLWAFKTCTELEYMQSLTYAEYVEQLEGMLTTKYSRRVDFLNAVLGYEQLSRIPIKFRSADPKKDPYEAKEQVSYELFSTYNEFLLADTTEFVNAVGELSSTKRFELARQLKGHLIDVGKIAVGTAVAMFISKGFRRTSSDT